jgi:hypothetical protein
VPAIVDLDFPGVANRGAPFVRLLEHVGGDYVPMPLVRLTAAHVERYLATRPEERAAGNTITKERVTLRDSLKVAARAGL